MLPLFCCTIGDTECTAPKEVKVFDAISASPPNGIALVLVIVLPTYRASVRSGKEQEKPWTQA